MKTDMSRYACDNATNTLLKAEKCVCACVRIYIYSLNNHKKKKKNHFEHIFSEVIYVILTNMLTQVQK